MNEDEGALRLEFLKDQKYGIIMGLACGLVIGFFLGILYAAFHSNLLF
jgi:hypothetical protein